MRFYTESLGLPEVEFALLRNLIHERTGLFFENGKRDLLADKLSPLVIERGFRSFLDYYYLLKYDQDVTEEWRRVMDQVTVQETYFWREVDQIRALVEVLIPQYVKENPGRPVRLWSAACASGEEPLTFAMALAEAGWFDRVSFNIVGSDASPAALAKARRGVYRDHSFRNLSPTLRERYFTPHKEGWEVTPLLGRRIDWRLTNLLAQDEMTIHPQTPFVFCRNAFIYFSKESTRRAVVHLIGRLTAPGYLFVGAAESLLTVSPELELQEIAGAYVYVKPGPR